MAAVISLGAASKIMRSTSVHTLLRDLKEQIETFAEYIAQLTSVREDVGTLIEKCVRVRTTCTHDSCIVLCCAPQN
jgi:hypothetical protein